MSNWEPTYGGDFTPWEPTNHHVSQQVYGLYTICFSWGASPNSQRQDDRHNIWISEANPSPLLLGGGSHPKFGVFFASLCGLSDF